MAPSSERTRPPFPRAVSTWARPSEKDLAAAELALTIACPVCEQPAGQFCLSPAKEPYKAHVSHPDRIKAARAGGAE